MQLFVCSNSCSGPSKRHGFEKVQMVSGFPLKYEACHVFVHTGERKSCMEKSWPRWESDLTNHFFLVQTGCQVVEGIVGKGGHLG